MTQHSTNECSRWDKPVVFWWSILRKRIHSFCAELEDSEVESWQFGVIIASKSVNRMWALEVFEEKNCHHERSNRQITLSYSQNLRRNHDHAAPKKYSTKSDDGNINEKIKRQCVGAPLSFYQLERFSPHFDYLCCSELSDRPDDFQRNRGGILGWPIPFRLKILEVAGHDLCDISPVRCHQSNLIDNGSNFLHLDGRWPR